MGIIPIGPQYGDDFLTCWAAGETPLTFKLFLTGVNWGDGYFPGLPPPPNGYHDIHQDPLNPGIWKSPVGVEPIILYTLTGATSDILIRYSAPWSVFVGGDVITCMKSFVNLQNVPHAQLYYGGTVTLLTTKNLSDIIESVTPMIDPDPRMECFSMEDGLIVVRYAGKRDATNVSIKFDTNV